ncbi:energy transducer TonB [Dyella solisilvae]|uniref:Energy transducer TonB n=2 Tax=Dyella solisilvae TaxID=1920168 RepID=A0A370KDF2_9GAMM|nr:energy transducer TonB [Dyella solisilvae]
MLFSLLLHGVLILGITFSYVKAKPSLPTLDVTLVDVANREAPDKADFLAQASNRGSGQSDKATRASQPVSGPLPNAANGTARQHVDATTPAEQEATSDKLLTTTGASRFSVHSDTNKPEQRPDQPTTAEEQREQEEMARLSADVNRRKDSYTKRPKKVYIDSANTREYAYAAYMRGWTDRIERVGNLNYPTEARRRGVHGDLLLTVAINRDGTIKSIDLIRSSGQPLLDAAAERIVRLAAPFPRLPTDAKEPSDELYISRTWVFGPNDMLQTR